MIDPISLFLGLLQDTRAFTHGPYLTTFVNDQLIDGLNLTFSFSQRRRSPHVYYYFIDNCEEKLYIYVFPRGMNVNRMQRATNCIRKQPVDSIFWADNIYLPRSSHQHTHTYTRAYAHTRVNTHTHTHTHIYIYKVCVRERERERRERERERKTVRQKFM